MKTKITKKEKRYELVHDIILLQPRTIRDKTLSIYTKLIAENPNITPIIALSKATLAAVYFTIEFQDNINSAISRYLEIADLVGLDDMVREREEDE